MKKILPLLLLIVLVSCKKDKENISDQQMVDSAALKIDSSQIPTIQNPGQSAAFELAPQNISAEKGRAIFSKNGKVLFYFDQNSNTGNVRIEGKDYSLNKFEFSENNYSITGNGVKIEAEDGDFKDDSSDCVQGIFSEVKVSLNDKNVNLTNISVKDCPTY